MLGILWVKRHRAFIWGGGAKGVGPTGEDPDTDPNASVKRRGDLEIRLL